MPTLSGFGSLAGIPEEKITDNITRRVLAGEKEKLDSAHLSTAAPAYAATQSQMPSPPHARGRCLIRSTCLLGQ